MREKNPVKSWEEEDTLKMVYIGKYNTNSTSFIDTKKSQGQLEGVPKAASSQPDYSAMQCGFFLFLPC